MHLHYTRLSTFFHQKIDTFADILNMKQITSKEEYRQITLAAANDYNKKDYQKALKKFLKMADVNYDNDKLHELLAYIYLNLDQLDKAEEEFAIFRSLIRENNPGITPEELPTFEDLLARTSDTNLLEIETEQIMESKILNDPDKAISIISDLATRYMAEGKPDKAEDILTHFKEKFFHQSR